MGQREHGTRAKYTFDKCRCFRCRKANAAYEFRRVRNKAYGRHQPFVDADPVREHINRLREAGKGWRAVAHDAGLPLSTVNKILYGAGGGRKPPRRIRPATAAAILAVRSGPGRYVPVVGARRRLQALVAIGHPQVQLAARLCLSETNLSALMRRNTITAKTDTAIRELYSELWDQPPAPVTGADRVAVNRAKARAQARGWLPPMAWDDGELDDPAAVPAPLKPPAGEGLDLVIDLVAVDRVVAGQADVDILTKEEFVAAAGRLADTGLTAHAIAARLDCSPGRARRAVDRAAANDTQAVPA